MNSTERSIKGAHHDDVERGPNEEATSTAQDNVSKGYGSAGKASIISGKPDGDTGGGPGRNNEQGKAASEKAS